MIAQVLEAVRGQAEAADAMWQRGERTSIAFEAGRLKTCGSAEEAGVNLRVVRDGRVGIAGTTTTDVADLVRRALASAQLGEPVALALPARASYPAIETTARAVADASLDQLITLGRSLVDRVARDGCQVNVSIERSVAETSVGNSSGVEGRYDSTGIAIGVDLMRVAGNDVLMVYDYYVGVDWPSTAALDSLVHSIATRLDHALRVVEPPEGALPVVFTPAGLSPILLPLEQGLSGKAVLQGVSPLAGKLGDRAFDERFTLIDDPLAPGRTSSRPFDDEGVPSVVTPLIERGVVQRFVYDLETAARAEQASTGNGSRGIFAKPKIAYSNLVVGKRDSSAAGTASLGGGLIEALQDGLVIDDLIGVGQGNVIGGAFSHPVALAYRVQGGEITGRVKDAAVAGNVYELLKRIGGFGTDGRWLGARWTPSLLLEGVSVARR
ncbi:MAG TPA: TldD/PmbA family protein [Gemmatimonadales bacterium]|nr:TldD/PmbA family protein [Gemmatimonadales bacterium]